MNVRVGPYSKLSAKELMLLNCGVGESSWESLGLQKIKPFNPKGNQSWIFTGMTDAEAEALILLPPDVKNWLIRKDPDAGKDWRQEDNGTTEDEMLGWHHWLNGHEFEQVWGVGDGHEGLACCSPWCHKESDMTEWLNWTDDYWFRQKIRVGVVEGLLKFNINRYFQLVSKKTSIVSTNRKWTNLSIHLPSHKYFVNNLINREKLL